MKVHTSIYGQRARAIEEYRKSALLYSHFLMWQRLAMKTLLLLLGVTNVLDKIKIFKR